MDPYFDRLYCQSAEEMPLPSDSVALAITSPPYNVGRAYDTDLSLSEHLGLIERVGREVYRVLQPGGRYVFNVANLWRKPYIPMDAHCWQLHQDLGFTPMGTVIWQKGKGASGRTSWGSWLSASAPVLRDIHEFLLVMAKGGSKRPDRGLSTISPKEFCEATLSIWNIPPASARRVGHPSPFPLALPERAIRLWSYVGDVVLDPFMGAGTTCVAAKRLGRRYVGFDPVANYVALAEQRLAQEEVYVPDSTTVAAAA